MAFHDQGQRNTLRVGIAQLEPTLADVDANLEAIERSVARAEAEGVELLGVVGLIAVNGFYSGKRVQQAHRTTVQYFEFRDRVREEYSKRARTGQEDWGDPFSYYPLDDDSRRYVEDELARYDGYDAESYSGELADSLLRWHPEAYAPLMRTPLLIAHGTRNALHPPTEAEALFSAYGGPRELLWIEGAGHTEWMFDDNPHFRRLCARIDDWLERLLERP